MNESLIWLITGIIYTISGHGMIILTMKYLDELEEKVSKIDIRYADRMYYHVNWDKMNKVQKDILSAIIKIFWPITCIAIILKAEKEFSIIQNHCYKKAP